MTKAEKEAEAKKAARREYQRLYWHKRTKAKTRKARAYKKRKAETKAEWQKANKDRHTKHVQDFYERHDISGREARAEGKKGAKAAKKRIGREIGFVTKSRKSKLRARNR
jgi:hypothetical protein